MLVATKPFTYATRRLKPGDEFEVKQAIHGRLLKAAKKAKDADPRVPGKLPAPPASLIKQVDETASLRADYERKFGKRPFMGWDAEMLKAKLAEA